MSRGLRNARHEIKVPIARHASGNSRTGLLPGTKDGEDHIRRVPLNTKPMDLNAAIWDDDYGTITRQEYYRRHHMPPPELEAVHDN